MEELESIVEKLIPYLPEKWDKVFLRAIILQQSYEFEYYVKDGETYTQCFEYEDRGLITELQFYQLFKELRGISNKMLEKSGNKWLGYYLTFDSEYHFDIYYTYDETDEDEDCEWLGRFK